eukprot:12528727-Alexandrium_andersonii.AAC.1
MPSNEVWLQCAMDPHRDARGFFALSSRNARRSAGRGLTRCGRLRQQGLRLRALAVVHGVVVARKRRAVHGATERGSGALTEECRQPSANDASAKIAAISHIHHIELVRENCQRKHRTQCSMLALAVFPLCCHMRAWSELSSCTNQPHPACRNFRISEHVAQLEVQ